MTSIAATIYTPLSKIMWPTSSPLFVLSLICPAKKKGRLNEDNKLPTIIIIPKK